VGIRGASLSDLKELLLAKLLLLLKRKGPTHEVSEAFEFGGVGENRARLSRLRRSCLRHSPLSHASCATFRIAIDDRNAVAAQAVRFSNSTAVNKKGHAEISAALFT